MTTAEWRYRRAKNEADRLNAKANHEDLVSMMFLIGLNLLPDHTAKWQVVAYVTLCVTQAVYGIMTRVQAKRTTKKAEKELSNFFSATAERGF